MINIQASIAQATEAANKAGDEYLAKGHGWFPCGNAHVQFAKKNTSYYRAFNKAGAVRNSAVVNIDHKHRYSQEYYLRMACAEAAKESLESQGVTGLQLWTYID